MKKLLALVLALTMILSFTACAKKPTDDTVSLKYYNEASELLPALKAGNETVALLAEPAVSKLMGMSKDFSIKLDVQEVYGGDYPQAVILVKKSVIESDGAFVTSLMNGVKSGASWIKNDAGNIADAVKQIEHYLYELESSSFTVSTVNKEVIERCNIYFEKATDAKTAVINYLQGLISVEESSTKIPSDEFFYDGSSTTEPTEKTYYTIVAPDGAPAMALAQFMYLDRVPDQDSEEDDHDYRIVSATKLAPYVMNKTADVILMPVNAAAKIAGTGSDYQMVGVATHGNLYIVSNQNISSLNDLKGKQVGVIGQGNVPDLTLRYVLNQNEIIYKQV